MPRVKKQVARKDIYVKGIYVDDPKTKSGKRRDRSKPSPEGDEVKIKKGDTYYTWAFKNGPKYESLSPPRRQQLTQSEYLISCYDLEDELQGINEESFTCMSELESAVQDLAERVRELADEQDEKFNNMPDSLQYSYTGELLEQRRDSLNEFADELDNIDYDLSTEQEEFKGDWLNDKYDEVANHCPVSEDGDLVKTEIGENVAQLVYGKSLDEIEEEMKVAWAEEHLGQVSAKIEEIHNIELNIE